MEQPGPKAVLIAELGASRTELESVVSQVPLERMTEPGATGSWSVKDVLAHLAVENDWLALQLERRARGEDPGSEELQRNQELGLADNETRNAYYAHLPCSSTWARAVALRERSPRAPSCWSSARLSTISSR